MRNNSNGTFIKYNNIDTLTTLEQVDDAAYQSDNTCRMPTKANFEELKANTKSTWETLNGVNGTRLTSKTNTNSIFIPAAGNCDNGSIKNVSSGFLWSSSIDEDDIRGGWFLYFYSDSISIRNDYFRYDGFSIRPVKD